MKMSYFALFFLSAAALAQSPTPPKPAVVEGKVINSVTGEALRKVDLTLATSLLPENVEAMMAMFGGDSAAPADSAAPKPAKKTYAISTDAAGKFRFEQVEAGDYFLVAKHAGYVDGHYRPEGRYSADGKLRLQAGDSLSGMVFRLVPQGALSGRLLDEDGDAVAGAFVSAQSYNYSSGRRRLTPADSAQTNDRGEFRLGKLPPGRYYLAADQLNMNPMAEVPPPPTDGSPEAGYVSTYYPKTTDISLAAPIDVAAGADLGGFTIQLQKAKVVRIKGKALAADGTPLKGAQIMLMNPSHPGSMQMRMLNGPDGRFEIAHVMPGSYMIMTMQMSGSTPSVTMQPLVVSADGLDNVQLGSQPEGTVQGTVRISGDARASGDVKIVTQGLTVMMAGNEEMPVMPAVGTVSETGAFTLKKVAAAPYQVTVPPPQGTYVKSVLWGGREKLGQPVDFTAGFTGSLDIVLGTDGGEFEATVSRDDKPVDNATVVLIAADPNGRFPETTRNGETDSTGHITLKDVPPGSYLAFAWEKVEYGQWFDPAFLKLLDTQAVSVVIQPKGHEKAQLQPIPAK